ncbi:hypothetical protein TELCIR_04070 [Teladorsagia circumcincta]|uniref:Uncharacterized protein n=1 Tax=Teladorsagia circumcincta TaxID=45464 RepID=A0A2G9UUK8_TELCI|nr:hypothetical protein TELCIR_04070 [Teladorsagia circumcincta]
MVNTKLHDEATHPPPAETSSFVCARVLLQYFANPTGEDYYKIETLGHYNLYEDCPRQRQLCHVIH